MGQHADNVVKEQKNPETLTALRKEQGSHKEGSSRTRMHGSKSQEEEGIFGYSSYQYITQRLRMSRVPHDHKILVGANTD